MKLEALEAVAREFTALGVRYLVAGGLAVAAHGQPRPTADIDVVIALDPANVRRTFEALARAGCRPTEPITAMQFADAEQRRRWIADEGMLVLNFHSDRYPLAGVDTFAEEQFDFEAELRNALTIELVPGVPLSFVSLATLIRIKERAARPRDLDDLAHLRWIREEARR